LRAAKAQDWMRPFREAGIRGWRMTSAQRHGQVTWRSKRWAASSFASHATDLRMLTASPSSSPATLTDLDGSQDATHLSPGPETTYVLALRSLALLNRASQRIPAYRLSRCLGETILSGCPGSSPTSADGRHRARIVPLDPIQAAIATITTLCHRLPVSFVDRFESGLSPGVQSYGGPTDPWWIHSNPDEAETLV